MRAEDWDARFAESPFVFSKGSNATVAAQVTDLAPGRALDVAAGEGRNAVWLAGQGWQVTAVDFFQVGLDKGRGHAESRGMELTWILADIVTWPMPAAVFELIIVGYLHLPPVQLRVVLDGITRALAPGGTVLMVGHDKENVVRGVGGPRDRELLYTPEELAAGLSELDLVTAERISRRVETEQGQRTAIDTFVLATCRG